MELKRSAKEGRPKKGRPKKKNGNIIEFPEVWMKQLKRNEDGVIKNTINNFCLILENDSKLKGKIALNQLSKRIEFNRKRMENVNLSDFKNQIELRYGIYSDKKFPEALALVAQNHKYHPIIEYLESLKWDGIKRADTAFHDYLGAEKNEYNAMCLRLILYGAIERVFNPRYIFWVYVNNKRSARNREIYNVSNYVRR